MRIFRVAALSVLVAGLVASASQAVTIYTLGVGNPAIAGYIGPYAEVSVTLTSATTADIVFTSLDNGFETFLLGNGGSVAVNVNAVSWALSNLSAFNSGIGFTTPTVGDGTLFDGGAGNEDGFGSFNQTINSFDGYSYASSSISFTLTNLSGAWASDADVLVDNLDGFAAAAHIFVAPCATADLCNQNTGALTTGYATVGEFIPEPSTGLLLGLGLIGLAYRRR